MERRAYKRLNANLEATLLYDHQTSLVRVTNCSENGACIMSISGIFPCKVLDVSLLIPVAKKHIKLVARIVRVTEINNLNYTIGVQFVKPPKKYLEFLSAL
jgi:hypothetical protein